MQIVMQVLGQIMDRFIIAYMLIKELLLRLVNKLLVSITQVYQSVPSIRNLLAQIKLSINLLVANLITQGQLIKVGLTHVLHKAGDLGQQLLLIARKIRQRVLNLLRRGN
jgi:hypothetical protein